MSGLVTEAPRFASAALAAVADPSKAPGMQAYMKNDARQSCMACRL